MASTTVTGFLFLALFIYFFDTPKEKILKNEIKTNQEQLTVFNKELDKLSAELDYLRQRDANTYRVIYEADPIPDAIWESGTGGTRNKTFNKDYSTAELMEKVDTKIESLKRKMVWQSKSYDELANLILNKEGVVEFMEEAVTSNTAVNISVSEGQTCPKCKQGTIIKGKSAFGCNRYKEGCDFRAAF